MTNTSFQEKMNTQIRHFLLTPEGQIREFSGEQAARVAAGTGKLPEFAQRRLRYLQVAVSDDSDDELKVMTASASIRFDADGRLTETGPISESSGAISEFEHEACVQWALRSLPSVPPTAH